MIHSPLQSMQSPAQRPGCFRFHTEASNHIGFWHPITVRADSRERHADYAVMLGDFGAEIGPQRVGSVIEDHNDVVAVADLPDGPNHRRNTMINPLFFAIWFWSLALEGAIADLEVATGRRKAFVLIQGGKTGR